MKTKHLFLFIIASFVMFVSCKDGDEAVLQLTSASVRNAPIEEFQHLISFDCNVPWTATIDVPWCTISQNQGYGYSSGRILVTGEANPAIKRTANIIIQAGSLSKTVTIIQAGTIIPRLDIWPTFLSVDDSGYVYTQGTYVPGIIVSSNWVWTAEVIDAEANNWCTITPWSGFGDGIITVSAAGNNSYSDRYAFISIVCDDVQRTDTIFQKAGLY